MPQLVVLQRCLDCHPSCATPLWCRLLRFPTRPVACFPNIPHNSPLVLPIAFGIANVILKLFATLARRLRGFFVSILWPLSSE